MRRGREKVFQSRCREKFSMTKLAKEKMENINLNIVLFGFFVGKYLCIRWKICNDLNDIILWIWKLQTARHVMWRHFESKGNLIQLRFFLVHTKQLGWSVKVNMYDLSSKVFAAKKEEPVVKAKDFLEKLDFSWRSTCA